jgi:hypothetical protein
VDPRAVLDDMEKWKFLPPPGLFSDPSVVQPVASRYTYYAITAPTVRNLLIYLLHPFDLRSVCPNAKFV